MTSFEERLARLDAHPQTSATPDQSSGQIETAEPRSGPGPLRILFFAPIAVALGAAAVLIGGVVQIAIIDGGLTPDTLVPPELGLVSFGIAMVLALIIDKIIGLGKIGPLCVTVGFVVMMWQEWRLMQAYPELWLWIYKAPYLTPVIETLGL